MFSDEQAISVLDSQIQNILENKKNHSKEYKMPENLSKKAYKALYDMEHNHDTSWTIELYLRNKNNLNKIALFYRGNKITYKEMFANVVRFAKTLKVLGVKKGDEVPVMVSNIPEYPYIFLAINLIGATMNTVGTWFHEDYLKEIIANSCSHIFFVSDDCYESARKAVEASDNIKKVIMFSLTDSLYINELGEHVNLYQDIDAMYHKFENVVKTFQNKDSKIIDREEYERIGYDYSGVFVEDMILDDEAIITYTSGTTRPGFPKGCVHSNRNYIAISRFKESDVSGMPGIKNLTMLAHAPSYTQTGLTTIYSDGFYMGCTIALEPLMSIEFFAESLMINKPDFVATTPGYMLNLAKKLNTDMDWKNVKMPFFMLPTIAGEGISLGEERYLNITMKRHKFGTDKLPFPFSPVCCSMGGGSTENGGLFITLFRNLQEKRLKYLKSKTHMELKVLPLAEVEILSETGEILPPNHAGLLVINSPCNQMRYVADELNESMLIKDKNKKEWYSGGCYAVKNKFDEIRIVGRPSTNIKISESKSIPLYIAEDAVNEDFKNVMSTVIVRVNEKYVCHIEKQPESKYSDEKIIHDAAIRLSKVLPKEIMQLFYFRLRSFEESFPLAPSYKRDLEKLIQDGIDEKCVSYTQV